MLQPEPMCSFFKFINYSQFTMRPCFMIAAAISFTAYNIAIAVLYNHLIIVLFRMQVANHAGARY